MLFYLEALKLVQIINNLQINKIKKSSKTTLKLQQIYLKKSHDDLKRHLTIKRRIRRWKNEERSHGLIASERNNGIIFQVRYTVCTLYDHASLPVDICGRTCLSKGGKKDWRGISLKSSETYKPYITKNGFNDESVVLKGEWK